jgi:hypothetical protein
VGLQIASSEMDEFKVLADSLGCDYAFESNNKAFQLLVHSWMSTLFKSVTVCVLIKSKVFFLIFIFIFIFL